MLKKDIDINTKAKKFGHSIDANDKYLIIGDPLDREFRPIENQYKNFMPSVQFMYIQFLIIQLHLTRNCMVKMMLNLTLIICSEMMFLCLEITFLVGGHGTNTKNKHK